MVEVCFADIAEKRDGVLSLISAISDFIFILFFNKQNLFRDLLSRDSLNGNFYNVYPYQKFNLLPMLILPNYVKVSAIQIYHRI